MQRFYRSFLFLTGLAAMAGCQVGPSYVPPQVDIPCHWHSEQAEGMTEEPPTECFLWWESLQDNLLNCLMKQAAFHNLDLYLAGTRILEARRERLAKSADIYPHVDGSLSYAHLTCNDHNWLKKVLNNCEKNRHHSLNIDLFEVGFDADWEIDLFGAGAHEAKALEAKVDASVASFYHTWVTLSAEIARNYVELRGFQLRLDLINQNIASQEDSIHLTQELLTIGYLTEIDLIQAKEQLSHLNAQKPLIELAINKTIHRLSILLGMPPGDLYGELINPQKLPCLPYNKPIGVPSELLRRRPDIRQAESNLAAATENVGTAVASLFPRLSLKGFIGDISTHLKNLCNPAASGTWFASPQLLMPIFNSKALAKDVDYSKLKAREALFEYQKTVLEALEEAENAIASFHFELERNRNLAESQAASEQSYFLTWDLFEKGFKSYLEVLTTQRSFFAAQEAYIQSQVDLLRHYIALYKALGGGWDPTNCQHEYSQE